MAHSIPRQKLSACTAQLDSGKFCDDPSLPDAPFPICLRHAAKIMAYLDDYAPRGMDDRMIVAVRMMEQRREQEATQTKRRAATEVVYYVRVGKHIKIGYTSNLRARMSQYPPDSAVLGYEFGGEALERQRHREFATDLRMGREWFAPSPQIMAHIAQINADRRAA